MSDLMHYKGYYGSCHLDEEGDIFYGKLEFIKALVTYESSTAKGIRKAFREAVDDYLKLCQQENINPEVPFKGSLNVRIGQVLHRELAVAAKKHEVSLNSYICNILSKSVDHNCHPDR